MRSVLPMVVLLIACGPGRGVWDAGADAALPCDLDVGSGPRACGEFRLVGPGSSRDVHQVTPAWEGQCFVYNEGTHLSFSFGTIETADASLHLLALLSDGSLGTSDAGGGIAEGDTRLTGAFFPGSPVESGECTLTSGSWELFDDGVGIAARAECSDVTQGLSGWVNLEVRGCIPAE